MFSKQIMPVFGVAKVSAIVVFSGKVEDDTSRAPVGLRLTFLVAERFSHLSAVFPLLQLSA
jgi:hypothetical protein